MDITPTNQQETDMNATQQNLPVLTDRQMAALLIGWAFRDGGVTHVAIWLDQKLVVDSSDIDTILDAMLTRPRCTLVLRGRNGKEIARLRWLSGAEGMACVERAACVDPRWEVSRLVPALNLLAHLHRMAEPEA